MLQRLKFGYKFIFDIKSIQKVFEDDTSSQLELALHNQILHLSELRKWRNQLIELSISSKDIPFICKRVDAILETLKAQIKRVEDSISETGLEA